MAQEFLIDRQFGQAIWIDVQNGIVQKCYNETEKFNARMNELYVGKTISFMKEDYKKRMSGTVQIFHPTAILSSLQKIEGARARVSHMYNYLTKTTHIKNGIMCDLSPAEKKALKEKIEEVEIECIEYKKELKTSIEEIETVHGYDCTVYRNAHLN